MSGGRHGAVGVMTMKDTNSYLAMIDTFIHGEPVRMPRAEWERDFSSYAIRLLVGRLLFGDRQAVAFAERRLRSHRVSGGRD